MDEKHADAAADVSRDGSDKEIAVNEHGVVLDTNGHEIHESYTKEEERRVVRKLDTAILPLVSPSRLVKPINPLSLHMDCQFPSSSFLLMTLHVSSRNRSVPTLIEVVPKPLYSPISQLGPFLHVASLIRTSSALSSSSNISTSNVSPTHRSSVSSPNSI